MTTLTWIRNDNKYCVWTVFDQVWYNIWQTTHND